jgi:hypothetical protein
MTEPRATLETDWLHLTRTTLPALAVERGWPVVADHCFQRILLDNACAGPWYDHVAKRPAYRHIATDRLAAAVALGRAAIDGTADLHALNRASLRWRGKRLPPTACS